MACKKCVENLEATASWIRSELWLGTALLPDYDWNLIAEALAKQIQQLKLQGEVNGGDSQKAVG